MPSKNKRLRVKRAAMGRAMFKETTSKAPGKAQRPRYKSMEEMRRAKGFKPGETPAQFNKRKALAQRAIKAAKATSLGKKLLLPVAAGVGTVQYLKSKMKKKKNK